MPTATNTARTRLPWATDAAKGLIAARVMALGPFAFQCAKALRDEGVLEALHAAGTLGVTVGEMAACTGLPPTGAEVLLLGGLGSGLVGRADDGRFVLLATGWAVLHDPMTRVHMDFTDAVCWPCLPALGAAVRTSTPAGLPALGPWKTIYEGLAALPADRRRAWLAFDHFFSDAAFPAVLPVILARAPRLVVDVGANTGRWSRLLLAADPQIEVALLDHPGQLALAREELASAGTLDRARLMPVDLLDHTQPFPTGADWVWMSQFLDCFAPTDITALLGRAAAALGPDGRVAILETFPDRQAHPAAADCLRLTSLYFQCCANGVSRMYESGDFTSLIHAAGLEVETWRDGLGHGHSLVVCRRAGG